MKVQRLTMKKALEIRPSVDIFLKKEAWSFQKSKLPNLFCLEGASYYFLSSVYLRAVVFRKEG
jgi:hypothetical protein